ncbi:hypothetical protein AMAG_00479 [Allomyces macrogynus ATCC 38327]|uniref:UTP--glucose-1-phosphate uridylyltransferase n=1 Tax=Allomyces macrogynus (strain ATCC 38327) TaxID=578462 RepID=A0A0L0RW29_ALLM3|nr:hypothetical protein AMAG_00479 [Allomyces macrogynus ATCC 38327]|eukprot:KNE54508.1 hypothetical protein AMAG_00479 [Allomyces macrogynus ATCC 38327]
MSSFSLDSTDSPVTALLSDRVRSLSMQGFEEVKGSVAAKTMRAELAKLINMLPDGDRREMFRTEMDNFYMLFTRYLADRAKGHKIDWNKIKSPNPEQIVPYAKLPACPNTDEARLLSKLAVLKLNGGLGTTMGCVGPKSAIEVTVPPISMNSFNTDDETKRIVQKHIGHQLSILTFNQSRFPRISKDSLLPCPNHPDEDAALGNYYPPGHGDLFESLENSGLLDQLIAQGKEWIFVSNVDNLGATVDTRILKHLEESGATYVMEVTNKTKQDIKGGHQEGLPEGEMNLDVIVNVKTAKSGEKVIQLETAVGAAIRFFDNAHGINVPRSRFLPVKSTSDLFLVTSDLYSLDHGQLVMNPDRLFGTIPIVKLGDHFKKVNDYQARFKGRPRIIDLDHLTVSGSVRFGSDRRDHIDIPSGSRLEDKVVTGNLRCVLVLFLCMIRPSDDVWTREAPER